jgi:hypothetical protein
MPLFLRATRPRTAGRLLAFAFAVRTLAASKPAEAADVLVSTGAAARASSWRGDVGGGGELRFGLRMARVAAFDVGVREELSTIDQRLNTGLFLGFAGYVPLGRVRPLARVYGVHQHEEGLVSVRAHPLGAVFGIGPGIRHRAGVGGALGFEAALGRRLGVDWVFVTTVDATHFPDASLGPSNYLGLGIALGIAVPITAGAPK